MPHENIAGETLAVIVHTENGAVIDAHARSLQYGAQVFHVVIILQSDCVTKRRVKQTRPHVRAVSTGRKTHGVSEYPNLNWQ